LHRTAWSEKVGTTMVKGRIVTACLLAWLSGCNVPEPIASTGGAGPQGVVVVSSDYQSTNISAVATDGRVLSESILSSASAAPGISAALSGDVVLPSGTDPSGRIVLIDRKSSVVTFVDPETAAVLGQISVATGFDANAQDWLQAAPGKAYVSRYATNGAPGAEPFDQGGDLLVVDSAAYRITGRIDLASAGDVGLPRADRMLLLGSEVWVSLQRLSADLQTGQDARIVGIDVATDKIAWRLDLAGIANCGGPVLAPSGTAVALACHGVYTDPDTGRSAVVLLDATTRPPSLARTFRVGGAVWPAIAFASEQVLVGSVSGTLDAPGRNDVAFALDLGSGQVARLLEAGGAFVLGDVLCAGGRCLMADAAERAVRVWTMTHASLAAAASIAPNPSIGLPPRCLGMF
jgi:hypothetical protein